MSELQQLLHAECWAIVQVLAAYFIVDFLTGVYHYVTDMGWNFPQQVEMFQDHHRTNTMVGFDWQPMVVALPGMLAGVWFESSFVIAMGTFGCLAQVPHYYAHRPTQAGWIRWLQRMGIIISPEHHAAHHVPPFHRNFCIFSGLNNFWMNPLVRLRP